MECEQCGNEYEAKRSSSKYCSAKCRKLAFQDENAKPRNAKGENANSFAIGTVNPAPIVLVVTPEGPKPKVPDNYRLEDCACHHCEANKKRGHKHIINHGPYKDSTRLADNEID